MATRTNGAGYVSIPTGGLPTSADNWSWCGWFERVGDQGAESIIVNFAGTAGTIGQLRINSDGDSIVVGNQSALSGTLHTLTNGAPVFLAISCNAGTMTAYARLIGGGSFATVTLARSSYTVSTSTLHGMTWGWQANGRLSHSKWFSRAVTAAEWGDQWDSEDVTAALSGVCVGDVRLEGANLTEALTATVGSNLTSSGTVTVEALSVNPFPVAFSYDGAIGLDLAISSAGALQLTRAGSVGLPLAISATAIRSATFAYAGSVGLPLSTSAISAATALYQYAGTIALPLAVAGAYAQNDALVYLGTVALPLSISAAVDYEAELATLDIPLEWQITVPPPTAHYTTTGAISLALGVQAAGGPIIPDASVLDIPLAWSVAGAPPITYAGLVALSMTVASARRTSVRIPLTWEIEGRSVRLVGFTWNILDGRRARLARLTHIRPRQSAIIAINPRQSVVGIRPRLSLLIYEDA